jgi:hypothetical protein
MHQHKLTSENKTKQKGGMFRGGRPTYEGPCATEEIWENQTYIPLRGWGTPYSVIAHFTDKLGEKVFSTDQFPDIPITEGYSISRTFSFLCTISLLPELSFPTGGNGRLNGLSTPPKALVRLMSMGGAMTSPLIVSSTRSNSHELQKKS